MLVEPIADVYKNAMRRLEHDNHDVTQRIHAMKQAHRLLRVAKHVPTNQLVAICEQIREGLDDARA